MPPARQTIRKPGTTVKPKQRPRRQPAPSKPFSPPTKQRARKDRLDSTTTKVVKAPGRLPRHRRRSLTEDVEQHAILIDDRAGSRNLMSYPPFDKCATLCRLDSADFAFVGNGPDGKVMVGVELKSITDLLGSTDNGRVQATQLPAMLDEYDDVWLLYYGAYRPSPDSHCLQVWLKGQWRNYYIGTRPVPYGYLEAFLIGLQAIGINVKYVPDEGQAAAWLAELVRWRTKSWGAHKSLRTFDRSRKITDGRQRKNKDGNRASLMPTVDDHTLLKAKFAAALPTLGYERGIAAARHFKSVFDMVIADEDDWAEVTTTSRKTGRKMRIGPSAAKEIVKAIHTRG